MAEIMPGFRVVGTLGQGARSTILQVLEESTGKFYALKRVVRNDADDQKFIEQVEIEFKVANGIDHVHLRRAEALHRNKKWLQVNEVCMLMEYVPGQTLEQHRPNRLDHFLIIFRKVALGLAALHDYGYVHADMKPNNVVLGSGGIVKIIDFGQSCPVGHRKERIQGTPDYMAPEQVRRLTLDQRTDVFNLGATMYWVLTGQTFPTDVPAGVRAGIEMVRAEKPMTPKEINPKFPLALSQLVMDCCQPNPKDRPRDMRLVETRLRMVQSMWRKKIDELKSKHRQSPAPSTDGEPADGEPIGVNQITVENSKTDANAIDAAATDAKATHPGAEAADPKA